MQIIPILTGSAPQAIELIRSCQLNKECGVSTCDPALITIICWVWGHRNIYYDKTRTMEKRKCRNWWVIKWFNDRETALAWEPPAKPKLKYCCWRVHECPTTKKIHAHILFQFQSGGVKFKTLENKGYNNIKWVKQEDLAKKRGYCVDDNHKKDGTPKGVIAPLKEIGQWSAPRVKKNMQEVYTDAFAARTYEEGVNIILEHLPRDYALHGDSIDRNLLKRKLEFEIPKYQLTDFNIPPIEFEEKAVLMWGDTHLGKTEFALAHFKNPLLVRHIDDLKKLRPQHDGIVFDDMSFTHWPKDNVKHLLDWNRTSTIHCRFSNAKIPAKTKKIFCSNSENPFYEIGILISDRDAIESRLKRINVTDRLF